MVEEIHFSTKTLKRGVKLDDKELLEHYYLVEELSMRDIAEKLKMSYSGVRYRMKKYKIPLRTDKEGMNTLHNRKKRSVNATGKNNSQWNGGRRNTSHGYIEIYVPNHPNASARGTVYEHRLIMEKKIGRYLLPEEDVHHIDEDKQNNHPDNLQLFSSKSEHTKHHQKLKKKFASSKSSGELLEG